MTENNMRIIYIEKGMFQYSILFDQQKEKINSQPTKPKYHFRSHSKQQSQSEVNDKAIFNTKSHKKVRFAEKTYTKTLYVWQFAHAAARRGEWQQFSIDKTHFNSRIRKLDKIISPILKKKCEKITKNFK